MKNMKARRSATVFLLGIWLLGTAVASSADDSIVTVKSAHGVKTTADRLETTLKDKGMTVFARIDHAAGAEKAGLELRPAELVIFGNPKVGTPFMQCGRTVALDLPQKALIWEGPTGDVWLSYNDPRYLADRHGVEGCEAVIAKIEGALAHFAKAATMP